MKLDKFRELIQTIIFIVILDFSIDSLKTLFDIFG